MPKLSEAVNSESFLHAALEGLELQKKRVEEQIAQVRSLLGRRGPKKAASAGSAATSTAPKRVLSEAARKRIAAAQKKRWAAYRKQTAEAAS